jgi:hypothetical protein
MYVSRGVACCPKLDHALRKDTEVVIARLRFHVNA